MKKIAMRWMLVCALLVMALGVTAFADEVKTEDGVLRIYNSKGVLVKNKPAYQVGKGKKAAYYQIDKTGAAIRWTGVEEMAAKQLCKLKAGSKKSTANLKKAFKWAAALDFKKVSPARKGKTAAKYYGTLAFQNGYGDCNSEAAVFYWMAKVLGYKVTFVQGYVPERVITNLQSHAWTTIRFGKTDYVYDPNFNRDYSGRLGKYCGFKIKYGQTKTYRYFSAKKKEIKSK